MSVLSVTSSRNLTVNDLWDDVTVTNLLKQPSLDTTSTEMLLRALFVRLADAFLKEETSWRLLSYSSNTTSGSPTGTSQAVHYLWPEKDKIAQQILLHPSVLGYQADRSSEILGSMTILPEGLLPYLVVDCKLVIHGKGEQNRPATILEVLHLAARSNILAAFESQTAPVEAEYGWQLRFDAVNYLNNTCTCSLHRDGIRIPFEVDYEDFYFRRSSLLEGLWSNPRSILDATWEKLHPAQLSSLSHLSDTARAQLLTRQDVSIAFELWPSVVIQTVLDSAKLARRSFFTGTTWPFSLKLEIDSTLPRVAYRDSLFTSGASSLAASNKSYERVYSPPSDPHQALAPLRERFRSGPLHSEGNSLKSILTRFSADPVLSFWLEHPALSSADLISRHRVLSELKGLKHSHSYYIFGKITQYVKNLSTQGLNELSFYGGKYDVLEGDSWDVLEPVSELLAVPFEDLFGEIARYDAPIISAHAKFMLSIETLFKEVWHDISARCATGIPLYTVLSDPQIDLELALLPLTRMIHFTGLSESVDEYEAKIKSHFPSLPLIPPTPSDQFNLSRVVPLIGDFDRSDRNGRWRFTKVTDLDPMSLSINTATRLLVIKGPNASGKSTLLRQIELVTQLGQAGLQIPAFENGSCSIFTSGILLKSHRQNDKPGEASTFQNQAKDLAVALTNGQRPSIFIIDEYGLASTTSAQCILDEVVLELMSRGTLVVAAMQRDEDVNRLLDLIQEKGLAAEVEVVSIGDNHTVTKDEATEAIANRPFAIAQENGIPATLVMQARERAARLGSNTE